MLNEEMHRYTELSGYSAEHESIQVIGAYLDGYDQGVSDVRENVKGEWIYTPIENGMIIAMCSICKKVSAITPSVKEWYRFCPNCGADMRGEA